MTDVLTTCAEIVFWVNWLWRRPPRTLDSDAEFHIGCQNVSHHQQHSFSGLYSPKWSDSIKNKTRHCISLISFHTRWTPTTAVAAKYKKTSPKVIKVTFHLIQRQKRVKLLIHQKLGASSLKHSLCLCPFYWAEFVAQRERAQEDFNVPFKGAPPHPSPIYIRKTATVL